jgi:acyl carrier protein
VSDGRIKDQLREYVVSNWLSGDERGFDADTDLQEAGVLDSFSTLALIGFLDETFHVHLEPAEVNADTFRTVNAIAALVAKKQQSSG